MFVCGKYTKKCLLLMLDKKKFFVRYIKIAVLLILNFSGHLIQLVSLYSTLFFVKNKFKTFFSVIRLLIYNKILPSKELIFSIYFIFHCDRITK